MIRTPRLTATSRLLLLGVACPLVILVVLAERVWRDRGFSWDDPIVDFLDWLAPVSSEEIHIDPLVTGTTFGVGALTALFGLALLVRRQFRAALFLAAGIGGAVALSSLAKEVVQRPSIEGEGGYSFPSGSATWSMATVAAVVLLTHSSRRRWLLALAGAVFIVAYSAVLTFEEWHYPSDVLAGWALAASWVAGLWLVVGRPRPRELTVFRRSGAATALRGHGAAERP